MKKKLYLARIAELFVTVYTDCCVCIPTLKQPHQQFNNIIKAIN